MACSPSNAKLLVVSLVDGLPAFSIFRGRGYAAAPHGASSASFSTGRSMVRKVEQTAVIKEGSEASSAWAPDPITGYYRPANCAAEIDPAELRGMLLNNRVRPH